MKKLLLFASAWLISAMAIAQHVNDYQLYHNEGRQLAKQGKLAEAITAYDKAIDTMPYYSEIYMDRGLARMANKDFTGAVADFNMVMKQAPHKTQALYYRAEAHYALGQYEATMQDLEPLLRNNPNDGEAAYLWQQADHANTQQLAALQPDQSWEVQQDDRPRRPFPWRTVVPLVLTTAAFIAWL